MKKIRIIAAVILFPLLLSLAVQGTSGQQKKKRRGHAKKMETVSSGRWGGKHIAMDVTATGATLDFDCAHATISQPLALDNNGSFDVLGQYVRERGGPVRLGEDQTGVPAHFKGRLSGQTLTLTITFDDSSAAIGPFSLELGKFGRVFKCN